MEENILLLREMQYNCINQSEYIDPKCMQKAQAIEKILNELENLQKENEELKQENKELNRLLKFSLDYRHKLEEDLYEGASNFILRKDKIREIIEEYKHKDFIKMQVVMKHDKEALKIVEVLEELLEEQN